MKLIFEGCRFCCALSSFLKISSSETLLNLLLGFYEVDGQVKCEKWIRDDDSHSEESKVIWWLNRLIGRTKKVSIDWPYPFVEGRLFVLTVSAGLEGYHINVDGRHVTSFPYRTVSTVSIFFLFFKFGWYSAEMF